jgi:hypothetical protein
LCFDFCNAIEADAGGDEQHKPEIGNLLNLTFPFRSIVEIRGVIPDPFACSSIHDSTKRSLSALVCQQNVRRR